MVMVPPLGALLVAVLAISNDPSQHPRGGATTSSTPFTSSTERRRSWAQVQRHASYLLTRYELERMRMIDIPVVELVKFFGGGDGV